MTTFTGLLQSVRRDGSRHWVDAPETWTQGRTLYGGISTALCLDAVRVDFPDLPPLRSAQIAFAGPAGGGVQMATTLIRRGKSAAFIACDLTADGAFGTRALFCFGGGRPSNYLIAPDRAPQMPKPADTELFFTPERRPNFAQNFEVRLAQGAMFLSGAKTSHNFYWVRHLDAATAGSMPALLALADVTPPAATILFTGLAPFSTMTWAFDVLDPAAQSPDGWWLCGVKAEAVHAGYSAQAMSVWASDGTPVIVGRQMVALFG